MREFRSRLSELLSDGADRRDHVLVTRNGRAAAELTCEETVTRTELRAGLAHRRTTR